MKRAGLRCIVAIGIAVSPGLLIAQSPPHLRDAPLPPSVQKDIIAAVIESDKGSAEDSDLQQIALNSSVSFLKLGQNSSNAIVVEESDTSPVCGSHGNCPFYIFLNVKGRAIMIFQAVGSGPSIEPSIHHGMHDISWADVFSTAGPDILVQVDRYDGKEYTPAYCYHQTTDETGKWKESPHLPCK